MWTASMRNFLLRIGPLTGRVSVDAPNTQRRDVNSGTRKDHDYRQRFVAKSAILRVAPVTCLSDDPGERASKVAIENTKYAGK